MVDEENTGLGPGKGFSAKAWIAWSSLAVVICLAYTLFTAQAWEDYYIAFRHSEHLVEGNGLTYEAGERIQGFSSPAATLALAATYALSGSEPGALGLFRMLSILAFAGALLLLLSALKQSGLAGNGLPLALAGMVLVLDAKSIAFSVNGMETGLWLFFLAGSLWSLFALEERAWVPGFFWAGMMWTRPDSALYIALLAGGWIAFSRARRAVSLQLFKAGVVCAAAYAPWFLFAWVYYGSPVPHSAVAKGIGASTFSAAHLVAVPGRLLEVWTVLYLPPYSEFSNWKALGAAGGLAAAAAAFYWLAPWGRPLARTASLATLGGSLYLALMPRTFPWYFPAVVLCSLPPLAALAGDALRASWGTGGSWGSWGSPKLRYRMAAGVLVLVGVGMSWAWIDCARTVRVMQRVVDGGNRREIGRWLAQNAASSDRVFLECPGYIGYYSGLEMLDYPGLVSPAVVRARRLGPDDFAQVARSLEPEWMVLRTEEIEYLQAMVPTWLRSRYRLARTFDVADLLRHEVPDHPGVLYDATFHVLRRNPE